MDQKITEDLEKSKAEQLEALVKIVNSPAYDNPAVKSSVNSAIRRVADSCK